MKQIVCRNLSIGYEGKEILKDINFEINSSDYLCIIGENGSGKSTLLKTILGLKNPVNGEIIFSNTLKKNELGYLPQQTNIQKDFPASVFEVVLSGRMNKLGFKCFYSKKDKENALKKMKLLNILDLKNKSYQNLSGGQQQRVLLARALCATKKILFLDEPMAGLDPVVSKNMYTLIGKINEKLDITIIMVSHDINKSVKYASHILHLGDSQLFFGTSEEYKSSNIGKNFLGGRTYD